MPDAAADGSVDARRMPLRAALEVLAGLRGRSDVVVTTMGAAREWPKLSRHPLDFHYIPSTMGGGIPLALGLALAQPHRRRLHHSGRALRGCWVPHRGRGCQRLSVLGYGL